MLGVGLETDCLWNLLHNDCQARSSKETFEAKTEFRIAVTAAKQRDGGEKGCLFIIQVKKRHLNPNLLEIYVGIKSRLGRHERTTSQR